MFNEFEKYIETIKRDKSSNTVRSYRTSIEGFLKHFSINSCADLEALTVTQIDEYRDYLLVSGLSKASVNTHIRPLFVFWHWLNERDFLTSRAIDKIKALKEEKKLPVYLTKEECDSLINACHTTQERVMISLMLATGMRREEISDAKVSDIVDGHILIHGKGSKERELPINDKVLALLNDYLASHHAEYLFTSQKGAEKKITPTAVWVRVKAIAKKSGIDPKRIEKIAPHKLRHTVATNLVRNGVNMRVIQDILGHSSISTTMRYAHVDDDSKSKALASCSIL